MDRWKQDRTETGPSWNDVQDYLRELHKTCGRVMCVETSLLPDTRGSTTYGLWVRVVAYDRGEVGKRGERAKGAKWPSIDHKTMPSLIIRLCHELDRELHDLADAAERQAAF